MSSAKVKTTFKFEDYLIRSLQDPVEAAAYIEAIIEEEEPGPTLLKSALLDVVEAFNRTTLSPEQAESQRQKLDDIFSKHGSQAIYGLAVWLNEMGLKLSVNVQDEDA
jgi:DNA-binding phage protein